MTANRNKVLPLHRPAQPTKSAQHTDAEAKALADINASTGTARVVISAHLHRRLRRHCFDLDVQMKQWLDEVIAEKLAETDRAKVEAEEATKNQGKKGGSK